MSLGYPDLKLFISYSGHNSSNLLDVSISSPWFVSPIYSVTDLQPVHFFPLPFSGVSHCFKHAQAFLLVAFRAGKECFFARHVGVGPFTGPRVSDVDRSLVKVRAEDYGELSGESLASVACGSVAVGNF